MRDSTGDPYTPGRRSWPTRLARYGQILFLIAIHRVTAICRLNSWPSDGDLPRNWIPVGENKLQPFIRIHVTPTVSFVGTAADFSILQIDGVKLQKCKSHRCIFYWRDGSVI